MPSLLTSPLVIISLVFGIWFVILLKRAYLTPLSSIPGPWYAKFTHLWLKKHIVSGRRLHYIHDMHMKYGPIVRIAPNEIDVSDPQVYKDVHRIGSGFLKDPWYHSFRTGNTHDVFSMIDPKDHSERRKLFAPLWTNTALHGSWESAVLQKVQLAVTKIKRDALLGESDIFKWWTAMTTDVISQLAFGESLNMLEQHSKPQYAEDLELAIKVSGALAEFPLLRPLLKYVPSKTVKHMIYADDRVQEYGRLAVVNAKSRNLAKANVFSKIIAESEKAESALTEYEVAFEAGGFIVAGSGTTAVSLTYLVWAVLGNPVIQQRLENEVAQLEPGFDDSQLEKLVYLNAVIDETLRLYGAAPGSLPRQTPKGGARLGGYFIPERTTVSSQAYTLHRNAAIYPQPNKFDPSRFITSEGEYSPPKSAYAPFGAGSRTCLGIHLAKMELRHGAAEFFRECRGARIAASMKPGDMEFLNFFLVSPVSGRCCVSLPANGRD